MAKVIIDPINRMEGHLKAECDIAAAESGGWRVNADGASLHGNMFRGFELIVKDRDPRDAMVLTQRH